MVNDLVLVIIQSLVSAHLICEDCSTRYELCSALESLCPGRKGSRILYNEFRNGFAHLRGPKAKFAIAEDKELGGEWADLVEVDAVGQFVAINIDRLAREFLKLLEQLEG